MRNVGTLTVQKDKLLAYTYPPTASLAVSNYGESLKLRGFAPITVHYLFIDWSHELAWVMVLLAITEISRPHPECQFWYSSECCFFADSKPCQTRHPPMMGSPRGNVVADKGPAEAVELKGLKESTVANAVEDTEEEVLRQAGRHRGPLLKLMTEGPRTDAAHPATVDANITSATLPGVPVRRPSTPVAAKGATVTPTTTVRGISLRTPSSSAAKLGGSGGPWWL